SSSSSLLPPPPRATLFPYTTLFRSRSAPMRSMDRALRVCGELRVIVVTAFCVDVRMRSDMPPCYVAGVRPARARPIGFILSDPSPIHLEWNRLNFDDVGLAYMSSLWEEGTYGRTVHDQESGSAQCRREGCGGARARTRRARPPAQRPAGTGGQHRGVAAGSRGGLGDGSGA